ncbi:MAG: NUDIX domain-containing protein [Ktedonobacterales bacterium]|nr:NUDIX domain-containing protein [Ktedonobacterales bacterium]
MASREPRRGERAGDALTSDDPSDDPNEVFDLVDSEDQVIGRVRRGDAHRDPSLTHRSIQVLVFTTDGRLLLQRRSRSKDLFPGYLCASASGHVASGDDYATTARREIMEELGVAPPLIYTGKTLVRSEPETEVTAIFVARCNGPFRFHPTETEGGLLLTWAAVWQGQADGSLAMTPALVAALDMVARLERLGRLEPLFQTL